MPKENDTVEENITEQDNDNTVEDSLNTGFLEPNDSDQEEYNELKKMLMKSMKKTKEVLKRKKDEDEEEKWPIYGCLGIDVH